MNIFFLDYDPEIAARYHCDKHIVKMITETMQIVSSALHLNGNGHAAPYRLTHQHHPCVKWASASTINLRWLINFGQKLYDEYKFRYGKQHKAGEHLNKFNIIGLVGFDTPPPQCMPEEFRVENEPVQAYIKYYRNKASGMDMRWTSRPIPDFMESVI